VRDQDLDRILPPGGALTGRLFSRLIGAANDDPPLLPGTRIGDWSVGKLLGRGGSSMVYLADRADGQFEQQVALKIVRLNQNLIEQFRRERQILAELRHPAIAQLIDGGQMDGGRLWFAMEPVFGERIDAYVRHRRLPLAERLVLFEAVCDAVAYAHSRLLIHRDIKPGNLLVDESGRPRLLDFGIATSGDVAEGGGDRAMTPTYASPEQRAGGAITTASDVFQLGLLLRVLVMPLDNPCDTLPRSMRTVVLAELAAIVAHATEHDPAHRYPTVAALRADLVAVRQRRPVSVVSGIRYPIARFLERNAIPSAIAAIGIAALLSTGWIAAHRVETERDQARAAAVRARATSDFLISLFTVSDPGENRGEKLTANQLLARGTTRLRSGSNDPAQSAAVALDIGRVYMELGEYARVREVLSSAIAADGSSLRVGTPEGVQSLILHGRASYFLGDYDMATKDFALARDGLALISDPDQRQAEEGSLGTQEAQLARRLGKLDQALALQRQAIDLLETARTPDAYQIGMAWNNAGLTTRSLGDYASAEHAFRRALTAFRDYGADHPRTFIPASNLAEVMVMKGDYASAEPLLVQSIQRYRDLRETPSNKLSQDLDMLSQVRLSQGRSDEAAALAQEAADGYAQVLGPEHSYRAFPLVRLGDALLASGDGDGALRAFREALRLRRATFGNEHRDVANSLRKLGLAHARLGDPQAAEAALREAVAVGARASPAGHSMLPRTRMSLVAVLIEMDRIAEAKAQLELVVGELAAAEAASTARPAGDAPTIALGTRMSMIASMIEQQRIDEAKAQLALAVDDLAVASDDAAGP
jgi:eukaryotic-like serine/threonine-protein kinase